MTEIAERLKQELSQLDARDRAEIAEFLLCSLDSEGNESVDEAWEAELNRRVAEIESGQAVGTPAEVVFARLREKYS